MAQARLESLKWLDEHWPADRRICPIDGSRKWQLTDLVQINRFTPNTAMIGDVYPAIQLVCATCGYMVHFNAIAAGVVQPGLQPPPGTAAEPARPDSSGS